MSADRIAKVEAWPVNVPLVAPYLFALGTYRGMSRTIIRVTTDDGVTGLGETSSTVDVDLLDSYGASLVGRPVSALKFELSSPGLINATNHGQNNAGLARWRAAIEMALWDIEGHTKGVPVHALLGDQVRATFPVTEYFAYRLPSTLDKGESTAGEMADYCARMIADHGAQGFEGKVATMPVEQELRMLRAVRRAIGDSRELRVDANLGWHLDTALRVLPQLAELGVTNIEEPVGAIADAAILRRSTSIEFSGHEPDFESHRRYGGVPDTFVLSVASCGGISGTLATIERCEEAGIGFWFYSGELGVATAASLHISAVSGYVTKPSQSLLRWYPDDVIEGGPFAAINGEVAIPTTPGLGVTLDEDGLKRGIERFADEGEYVMYDAPSLPRY
jgi:glucarate dehydratase